MVGSLVDLLDLSAQFQKVSLRIFKVGEQHVPRAVAARSVHSLEPSIAQMNNGLRQLRASREIERSMLHAALRQRDKAERVMVRVATEECCLLYTSPSPRDGLLSRMPSSA